MNRSRIFRLAVPSAVILIYITVRFWNLTATCLWFDEIFSVHAAEHSWDSILSFVALDLIHPPLFYVLLKGWIAAGGESLQWLRAFPVLFSVVAILPFLRLCRELRLGKWATTFALSLIAVNGSLIKYAQELRMYSMLMCFALFSMWLFARYFRTGKGIALLAVVNVVLIYTHYFGWFMISSELVAILIFQRVKWRPILIMCAVALAAFVPWLIAIGIAARSGSELGQNIGWMQRPGPIALVQLALNLVEPFYYPATSIDPISIYQVSMPLLLIAIVAFVLYVAYVKDVDTEQTRSIFLLLIFIAVPLLCAFTASWILPYSIWGTRHLIIVFVPIAILLAVSITASKFEWIRVGGLVLVILFAGLGFVLQMLRPVPKHVWCGFDELGEKTLAKDDNGPVYVFEDLAAYHLWFTFRNEPDPKMRQHVVKVDGFPGMDEDKAYFLPRGMDDEFYVSRGKMSADPGPTWVVYRAPNFDPTKPPLNTLLANGLKVQRMEVFDGTESKVFAVFLVKKAR
jgi:uncharacterized membrane protein